MDKDLNKPLNRIKVVMAGKNKPSKYLSDPLGAAPTTVSKWVTNSYQPTMIHSMSLAAKCIRR